MVKNLLTTLYFNPGELSMSDIKPERRQIRSNDDIEEIHELVWKAAERQPRFPVNRIRKGKEYKGLDRTLMKPHGFQSLMEDALKYLEPSGKRRWDSFLNRLSKRSNSNHVVEMVDLLIQTGIVCLTEKNIRPNKGEYWHPFEISVDERARIELARKYPNKRNEKDTLRNSILSEIQELVDQWNECNMGITRKIEEIVQLGIDRLKEPSVENGFPINPFSTTRFRSVLLTLGYGRLLLGNEETMPLRALSSLLWDNTKILDRYQTLIERILCCPLGLIGLETHPDMIWGYGDINYSLLNQRPVSLLAGRPPVLTRETILESSFSTGFDLKSILVIENLTVFLTVLRRTYYNRRDVFVLWSGGYWNRLHRKILRSILSQKKLPVFVWSDMDGDGLVITQQICSWIKQQGSTAEPLLMGAIEWEIAGGERMATERDITIISNLSTQYFTDLIPLIKDHKKTIEQERLLVNYDYVSSKLP